MKTVNGLTKCLTVSVVTVTKNKRESKTMKNRPVGIVNPVAKALLQERKSPQVVPPKKGNKRKPKKKEKQNALRDAKLY
jgi:hypothetical protein